MQTWTCFNKGDYRDIHANHWEFVLGSHVPTAMDGDEGQSLPFRLDLSMWNVDGIAPRSC